MLPTGHEGPYSLETLEKRLADKKLSSQTHVWREGLPVAIPLKDVLSELEASEEEEAPPEEFPPPLPPLPGDAEGPEVESVPAPEEMPEIPLVDFAEEESVKKTRTIPVPLVLGGLLILLVGFGAYQWLRDREVISIRRYPKMSLEIHQRIEKELKFEGFDKKIFFREFVAPDLTHIWLVTSGFQRCDVEAQFSSVKERLLTMGTEEVAFVSRGKLAGHVAELSSFEFRKGSKIIPGLYELDVKASRCEWDGIVPKLRNFFMPPEREYAATTRVILYPQGPDAFQTTLSQLLKKKEEIRKETEGHKQMFWDDLQMRYQTLQAITIQIEQYFLDFLDKGEKNFPVRLKTMVNAYTKQFGQQLTGLVVDNESLFAAAMNDPVLKTMILGSDYEGTFRSMSKQVGLESMKVIEELQGMKRPKSKALKELKPRVLKSFAQLKSKIEALLLAVTADRSNSP